MVTRILPWFNNHNCKKKVSHHIFHPEMNTTVQETLFKYFDILIIYLDIYFRNNTKERIICFWIGLRILKISSRRFLYIEDHVKKYYWNTEISIKIFKTFIFLVGINYNGKGVGAKKLTLYTNSLNCVLITKFFKKIFKRFIATLTINSYSVVFKYWDHLLIFLTIISSIMG